MFKKDLNMTHTISWAEYLPVITFSLFIKFCIAIIIMLVARLLIRGLTPTIHDLCTKNNLDNHSCHIITKAVRYIVTIFFGAIALQNLGIELSVFIAVFGITGVVLSYGMKDIVANFIASVLILGYKNIKIGDYIKIKDWEGTVVDINLRYTTLEYQKMTIFVPNIVLYTSTVGIIKS
jgi:small-conductance mechanosensitive channel